jgi:hypothetical protein
MCGDERLSRLRNLQLALYSHWPHATYRRECIEWKGRHGCRPPF